MAGREEHANIPVNLFYEVDWSWYMSFSTQGERQNELGRLRAVFGQFEYVVVKFLS